MPIGVDTYEAQIETLKSDTTQTITLDNNNNNNLRK